MAVPPRAWFLPVKRVFIVPAIAKFLLIVGRLIVGGLFLQKVYKVVVKPAMMYDLEMVAKK